MAPSYRASLKATRMQAVLDDIDNHASPATLEIWTAAFATLLATIPLDDPSFSRSGAVLTMLGVPNSDASADAAGTAALARIKDGGGTTIVELTVGTVAPADIVLNAVVFSIGQTVTIASGTITHAA